MKQAKKNNIKNVLLQILVAIISAVLIFSANAVLTTMTEELNAEVAAQNEADGLFEIPAMTMETATVKEVIDVQVSEVAEGINVTYVLFTAELTSGEQKGEIVEILQQIDEMYVVQPEQVKAGDRILVSNDELVVGVENTREWNYTGENKVPELIILVVGFIIMILLIGRLKGFAAITSLAITISTIFLVYVPAILLGANIYITTIIITLFIIFSNLLTLNGFNKKTFCAILGNSSGILVAGVLSFAVNRWFDITGLVDQDYIFLTMLGNGVSIDLVGLVWSAILIGSLGAVMDVAVSIASSLHELAEQMKVRSFKTMVRSGMNIGRDLIGTMTNTLILAYIGTSLAIVLLFVANNKNILSVLNLEMIIVEVIQAVVGSVGILVAVPLTVLVSATIYNKKTNSAVVLPITEEEPVGQDELLSE